MVSIGHEVELLKQPGIYQEIVVNSASRTVSDVSLENYMRIFWFSSRMNNNSSPYKDKFSDP